ncbi:MAG: GTPase ObgE [Firmicutes bacterium]|nr:GTPase ObgE [Bacillota bacterium]MBQ6261573.1 GTPase ObgE [Bacillota bacterium]MBR0115152.1 GTPase ObgE [Bacillota bacterium]MBR0440737.1 GTPase ObgE [Bacillota bacterium]
MFVDKAQILIRSGKGGNGAVSFRREPFIPQGGPDGGNGGRGGDIIIKADGNLRTLMDFRYKRKYEAENGEDGRGRQQYGKDGKDLLIKVPVGTIVKDVQTGNILADLKENGSSFVAAKGGKGGKGNVFYKNSVRQAPNFAEAGGASRERTIELELKLLADVGLIGFPNVGKSSFLSVSTNANPKIADYHFTTIYPNLGIVSLYDNSFVLVDIPGLIEGASEGLGMGHEFLKHVERTKVLIHVVDVSGSEGRDPIEDFETINSELKTYSEKLASKPVIVAANKIDLADDEALERFTQYAEKKGYKVYPMCAPINEGVKEVLDAAYQALLRYEEENEPEEIAVVSEPDEDPDYRDIHVSRENGCYVVTGKQLRKIFDSTNFNDTGSLRYLYKYIEGKGAIQTMLSMGMKEGDTIRVFDYEFEYVDE